jgi:hypothetical protein
MMECRDLALNNLPDFKVGGSRDSLEPMARDSHPRSLPPFWAEPTSSERSSFMERVLQTILKNFYQREKDSALNTAEIEAKPYNCCTGKLIA